MQFVDHDHFTGLLRELICTTCNTYVGACLHPAGCFFAEYLNHRPAAYLALRHPSADKPGRQPRNLRRAEVLGYNPLWMPGAALEDDAGAAGVSGLPVG